MADRCDLTDLIVDQCACPTHRGDPDPAPEEIETVGQSFDARFPGFCLRCERHVPEGDRIIRAAEGGYVHAGACPR